MTPPRFIDPEREASAMSIAHVDDLASTVEEELAELLRAAGLRGRQAGAVAARLGWDGRGGCTLAVAAGAEGYSRERVRQLEERLREHARRTRPELSVTRAALRSLEDAAPIGLSQAAEHLAMRGLARTAFGVRGLLVAADVVGIDTCLHAGNGVLLRSGDSGVAAALLLRARRVVVRHGAGRVEELALGLGSGTRMAGRLLELQRDVHWLDERHSWFAFRDAESRATRTLEKMLSVADALSVTDVDEGLRRPVRAVALPLHVVRGVCSAHPQLEVDRARDIVSAAAAFDPARTLSPLEQRIVAIFRDAGEPTLTFSQVVELARRDGLKRSSVAPYLTHMAVLKTVSRGRYMLRRGAVR
jgi:hypothetical protein